LECLPSLPVHTRWRQARVEYQDVSLIAKHTDLRFSWFMFNYILTLPIILLALLPVPSAAQTPARRSNRATSPGAYKLIEVKVTGNQEYSPEDIVRASGLQIGESVNEDSFKQASQKLGETGLFTDVAYSFSYSAGGTKLSLQVKENEKLIPLVFDNFPWFSDQELIDKVHHDIPLFHGRVPLDGVIVDQVADIIAALIAAKNPQFHVNYLRSGEAGGPIDSIVFSVNGANIRIRNVEFPGAAEERKPDLAATAKKIQGAEYTRTVLAKYAKFDVRPIYLRQGFLKVDFATSQARAVSDAPDQTLVDVQLPIEEGKQYKLAKLDWSGNSVFPAAKLAPLIHTEISRPANQIQLEEDLKAVAKLYGTRGYVKAHPELQSQLDDSENTVAYKIEMQEGQRYAMGDVDIEGLDEKTRARLREDWKLRQGEPYDTSYSSRFLHDCMEVLPRVVHWYMKVEEAVNDDEKTVDVTLRFSSTPTQ
jgi:outer membrane protein assembly factor BamA